jgi:chlorite dismutase
VGSIAAPLIDHDAERGRVCWVAMALVDVCVASTPVARVSFVASRTGEWRVQQARTIRGESLAEAQAVSRVEGHAFVSDDDANWVLRGIRSNERYLERAEKDDLLAVQEALGRPTSRVAVLIPIRKTATWWEMAQDERRAIFEGRSRHIKIGAKYLPAIARRLYHCRDLGEPFDFLTWFEFSEDDSGAFDELAGRLRETEEWRYVAREVEIRLRLAP